MLFKQIFKQVVLASLLISAVPTAVAEEVEKIEAKTLQTIASSLVDAKGEKPAKIPKMAKYTLFYFSAHWCPPCRAFTPKLVEFVEKYDKGDLFEVVFISSDRDKEAMLGYMTKANMPWYGFYDQSVSKEIRDQLGLKGIPSLALVDKSGKVLLHSYSTGGYTGPAAIIDQFKVDYLDNEKASK